MRSFFPSLVVDVGTTNPIPSILSSRLFYLICTLLAALRDAQYWTCILFLAFSQNSHWLLKANFLRPGRKLPFEFISLECNNVTQLAPIGKFLINDMLMKLKMIMQQVWALDLFRYDAALIWSGENPMCLRCSSSFAIGMGSQSGVVDFDSQH